MIKPRFSAKLFSNPVAAGLLEKNKPAKEPTLYSFLLYNIFLKISSPSLQIVPFFSNKKQSKKERSSLSFFENITRLMPRRFPSGNRKQNHRFPVKIKSCTLTGELICSPPSALLSITARSPFTSFTIHSVS